MFSNKYIPLLWCICIYIYIFIYILYIHIAYSLIHVHRCVFWLFILGQEEAGDFMGLDGEQQEPQRDHVPAVSSETMGLWYELYMNITLFPRVKGSSSGGGLFYICASSHLLIFTPTYVIFSYLLIFSSSHLHMSSSHIFTASPVHTYICHLLISLKLLIFSSSHLHISSLHLLIFTSAHLICTSSHLHSFTSLTLPLSLPLFLPHLLVSSLFRPGAVPTAPCHEMQPFRTEWGSISQT